MSPSKNRLARMFFRLLRCESGGSELLSGTILAAVGILGASMSIKPFLESSDLANDAMKHQAGVLSRGADTGAWGNNGSSQGGNSNGFDIGSAFEKVSGIATKAGEAAASAAEKAQQAQQAQQKSGGQQGSGTGGGSASSSTGRGHR